MTEPEGVRIIRDGTATPCHLTYVGQDSDGMHRWKTDATLRLGVDEWDVDFMPNSCIEWEIQHEPLGPGSQN